MTRLGLHLAGPGFPRPVARRRTFVEWVLNAVFRGAVLCISLFVIAIAGLLGLYLLAALAILL